MTDEIIKNLGPLAALAGIWEYKSAIREIEKETKLGLYDPRCLEVLKRLFGVEDQ